MKKYENVNVIEKKLAHITCNCCGEKIETSKSGRTSDHLSIEKRWGYFSPFDNEVHSFDLCTSCYDKIVSTFKIPVNCEASLRCEA